MEAEKPVSRVAPRWTIANRWAVPGTGNRRRRRGRYYRRPRNISIKRALLSIFGTLKGICYPPNNYDDIARSSADDRNWKRFRKTRWNDEPHGN